MTDREKAIVMAYTGVTMLTGDKLGIFYKYIEELLGHSVMTHELADQDIQDEIARKSKEDFIALCRDDSAAKYDMNDLISRKATLEAVKIPNGKYSNPSERHGIIIARVEATKRIMDIPSVPAVPRDKLCEWLAKHSVNIPCKFCTYLSNNYCTAIRETVKPCLNSAHDWRRAIMKWMEGLDATN